MNNHGRIDMLRYAYEHGCPWNFDRQVNDNGTAITCILRKYDCMVFCKNNGCPYDIRHIGFFMDDIQRIQESYQVNGMMDFLIELYQQGMFKKPDVILYLTSLIKYVSSKNITSL